MEKPRYWNIWWTLTVLSAAFTILVALLEALGVFPDLGLFLSILGAILTLIFGFSASTRSSLAGFRAEMVPRLDRIDERLGRIDHHLGRMDEHLERMVTLLDERLPRPTA